MEDTLATKQREVGTFLFPVVSGAADAGVSSGATRRSARFAAALYHDGDAAGDRFRRLDQRGQCDGWFASRASACRCDCFRSWRLRNDLSEYRVGNVREHRSRSGRHRTAGRTGKPLPVLEFRSTWLLRHSRSHPKTVTFSTPGSASLGGCSTPMVDPVREHERGGELAPSNVAESGFRHRRARHRPTTLDWRSGITALALRKRP
jgi:hypothetical protein